MTDAQARYRENNPHKLWAQKEIQRAIRNGWMTVPSNCEQCGKEDYITAHHERYHPDFARDVVWLCIKCHRWADKRRVDDAEDLAAFLKYKAENKQPPWWFMSPAEWMRANLPA